MEDVTLIFDQRQARRKARRSAEVEATRLLCDLHASVLPGGPLSERGGVFWISLSAAGLQDAVVRLPHLGYSVTVDALEPEGESLDVPHQGRVQNGGVRWRRNNYYLVRLHEDDAELHRERAPDRREFLLPDADGVIRPVRGYRGDSGPLTRRGFPVCDARLLVNLVVGHDENCHLLDPFAGIGGIALEAKSRGCTTTSVDIDPFLRHGLSAISDEHYVGDACSLPFADKTFDAIASEPPFHESTGDLLANAIHEMKRVLRPGGRIALMCAQWQAVVARDTAKTLSLSPFLDQGIDRKGLGNVVIAWESE